MKTGRFIQSRKDLEGLVVGVSDQRPVYLRQVADIIDGPTEATSYVWLGPAPVMSRLTPLARRFMSPRL